jgi:hypothetical protein
MSAVLVALGTHIPERRDQFRIRYRALGRPLFETGEGQFPVESTMVALRLEKPGVSLSRLMREQATWRDGQESRQAEP